jgi:hypothetical protein
MTKTDKALKTLAAAKTPRPRKLGKGLAIAGIWIGVGIACLNPTTDTGDLAFCAAMASVLVALIF